MQLALQLLVPRTDDCDMTSFFTRRRVLALLLVALTWVFASAAVASSPEAGAKGRYRGECRRLTKQIDHFEGTILPMARARGNRGWERSTSEQVERLWHRRADLCPAYGAERTLLAKAADDMRKFRQMIAAAGRAAATYFSGGLAGGVVP
jgi:hypothetical protein